MKRAIIIFITIAILTTLTPIISVVKTNSKEKEIKNNTKIMSSDIWNSNNQGLVKFVFIETL